MPYTNRPFNYTGTLPNQVQNDLELANDNFDILAQAFVNNDPTSGIVKNANTLNGFRASQTPAANTIPVAKSDGKIDANWIPLTKGNFYKVTFTTSGTWVVPDGVQIIWVTGTAGGGGGGGGQTASSNPIGGGGGGSGAFCYNALLNVTPGETLTVTIGAGGAEGNSGAAGGNGGNTIITGSISGTLLSLEGGYGGQSSLIGGRGGGIHGGAGGSGSENGGDGVSTCAFGNGAGGGGPAGGRILARYNGGSKGANVAVGAYNTAGGGGGGGASFFGPGGKGGDGAGGVAQNGQPGQGYGAGGGGGGGGTSSGGRGGAGGSGYIEIIYFA